MRDQNSKSTLLNNTVLSECFAKGTIWQGGGHAAQSEAYQPSDIALLDNLLRGGWRKSAGHEMLANSYGGEWHILIKQLARATQQHKYVILIAPPMELFAQYFARHGVDLNYMYVLTPQDVANLSVSIEHALNAQLFEVVIAWDVYGLNFIHLRKCFYAARKQDGLFFLMRTMHCAKQPSPAQIRLTLQPKAFEAVEYLEVTLFKSRGLLAPNAIRITLPEYLQPEYYTLYSDIASNHKSSVVSIDSVRGI